MQANTHVAVRFRPFAGPADFPAMLAVIEASKLVDKDERSDTVESLAHSYSHLANCDPYQDMVMAEAGDELIGYGRCWWQQQNSGLRTYTHFGMVKPAWRRRGVGTQILVRLQARLRILAAEHRHTGPRLFEAWASDSQPGLEAMLLRDGYAAVRNGFLMVRPNLDAVPAVELPPGLEVRPVEPAHYRAIWEADIEAFQDHWGSFRPTEEEYKGWLSDPVLFTPELWQVAWDGDEVAGMVRSFINEGENEEYGRRRGYTEFISTRRPWRRRGLAQALILRSLSILRERGMTEAALGVDAENTSGALRLYERCGFRQVRRSTTYHKALD